MSYASAIRQANTPAAPAHRRVQPLVLVNLLQRVANLTPHNVRRESTCRQNTFKQTIMRWMLMHTCANSRHCVHIGSDSSPMCQTPISCARLPPTYQPPQVPDSSAMCQPTVAVNRTLVNCCAIPSHVYQPKWLQCMHVYECNGTDFPRLPSPRDVCRAQQVCRVSSPGLRHTCPRWSHPCFHHSIFAETHQ